MVGPASHCQEIRAKRIHEAPESTSLYCGHCYQINPGTIAGVVLGDLFLTLFIALGVYYVVSCIYKQQATSSGKEEGFPRPQQGRRNGVFQTWQL
uniref:TYRO protein tyrosine kinase-binding protein n=1 Tax=Naja naja TaxID=35670 RepID=A0A8C6XYN6_NAJNA